MWALFRKLSLDNDNFPAMLENVDGLLRTITINIYKNPIKRISWVYYTVTIVAALCYTYVYMFSMLWLVFIHYSRTKNFTGAIVALSLGTCSLTCITKFLFMILHITHIKETVDKFLSFDAQVIRGTRFELNLRKNLRVVKKRAILIWIFLVLDGAFYAIIPYLRPGRHVAQDLFILYGFDPIFESPNYEIVSVINTISIYFAVYIMVNVAIYVIVIVGYNEAQLYAISEEVKNVWDDSQNYYNDIKYKIKDKIHAIYIKDKIINEYIRIRLKTIVNYHVTNINLFHELDNEFSDTLAIEYSIMCIAIITELLGGLENTYLQLPYTIVQIFMDCLSGQRLMDACNELENSLYSCKWENYNTSNRKTVLLMLLISQKTLMLSAGGMTRLNFNCFMLIVKSTYSAYTSLKSTMK